MFYGAVVTFAWPVLTWRFSYARRQAMVGGPTFDVFLGGLSGCVGAVSRDNDSVSVLAAGSLYNALEYGMHRPTGSLVEVEAHGSVQVARMIASGQKSPDIVALADDSLFDSVARSSVNKVR